eukprot:CAMPEP_0197464424 /NCGR_PEP_ID=MMETSP1175-20131217/64017_1 /TAXON_ID=1003142 /ORGANISM="Triceratium dubium, Strain CCMP147" /LENGTH=365 /DNA_ID=CAMNT_0043000405 /DNA_START=97 /DNA_END=1195 /DNA_ORIENTATION=+
MGSDTQEETKLASGAPEWIELHSDKSKAELVRTSEVEWKATSQAGGVYRKMIERQGTEKVARATTIVKFSPNQSFPRHVHDGGEEFLVLDGVWKDDYGDFGKYSYIRNYIGSGHTPSIGEEGCVILVKLRQMSLLSKGEPEHKNWGELTPIKAGGVYRKMIERQGTEKVARATTIVKFSPNQSFPRHVHDGGEEFLVLDGVWKDDYGDFPKYSYIRNYIGSGHTPSIGEEGCVILVKLRQMSLLSKGEPEHKNWGELTPDQVSNKGRAEEDGTKQVPLFSSPLESTSVRLLPKGSSLKVKVPKHGAEIFVVDGTFTSELGTHNQWSWCRVPNEEDEAKLFEINTLDDDVYVWVKEGHLASDEIGV